MVLYRIFLFFYPLAARLAGLFNEKAQKWTKAQASAMREIEQWQPERPVIWMHCASQGEFEQGLPVLEAIRKEYPGYQILLSFFSPSGYEPFNRHPVADKIVYLPLDGQVTAEKWVRKINPALVIFIKYEFWYFYLQSLHSRQIPVLLMAAVFRPSQPFFKWYGGMYRKMLSFYQFILVQDNASAQLLQSLQIPLDILVAGDSRYDRVLQIAQHPKSFPALESFIGGKDVFIAGSTWPEDDKALQHFVQHNNQICHIIVPHLTDSSSIARCQQVFPGSIVYSQWENGSREKREASNLPNIIIIDATGMLSNMYRYATIAYIGGGFGAEGIHNILEATVYGIPVVIGPIFDKFLEAIELADRGGLLVANNALALEEQLQQLLKNAPLMEQIGKVAQQFTQEGGGTAKKVLQLIQENRLLIR
ncbi:MAG: 3-deoxy-D-manno-octulosonic acid transferase [Sediminibacterium sp.]